MPQVEINEGQERPHHMVESADRAFVSFGRTINMGNYESIRVDLGEGCALPDNPKKRQTVKAELLTRTWEEFTVLCEQVQKFSNEE